MDKTLEIDIRHQDEMMIIRLRGRLDTLGARQIEETLSTEFTPECRQIFLDMKDVVYLSSAGIRILIKYYKLCHESSGELVLQNVPQQAVDVLKMVGLEKLILEKGKQPKKPEKQMAIYKHIHMEWWKFHDEMAEIVQQKSDEKPLLFPNEYETIVGRAIDDETDGQTSEFISIGAQVFQESQDIINKNIRSLYHVGTIGSPSHLFCFCCQSTSVGLEEIIKLILDISESHYAGIAGFVRSGGLVGCRGNNNDTVYSSQPLYANDCMLLAGCVRDNEGHTPSFFTRPLSRNGHIAGHFHAAVSPGLIFNNEEIDLNRVMECLKKSQRTYRIFHLINDDRPIEGTGESRFYEGSLWLSKAQ